jgi:hypothetical protein
MMFLKTAYKTKANITDITLITRIGTLFSRLIVCLETTQGHCTVCFAIFAGTRDGK